MKAQKFIINDGCLIMGQVEIHKDLVQGRDEGKTIGGGRWHIDDLNPNIIYFYGSSIDFGKVTREQFDAAYKQSSLSKFTIIFSEKEYMSDVIKEQLIKK